MNQKEIQKKQQNHMDKIEINDTRQTGNTRKKYQTAYNNFNQFLEQTNTMTIDQDNVNDVLFDYLKYLTNHHDKIQPTRTLSSNTINQYMILIKNFITNICKLETEKITQLKFERKEPKYIVTQQYDKIINHLVNLRQQAKTNHQKYTIDVDILIIKILFNTGLRIHELLNITIQEIMKLEQDGNKNYQMKIIGKGNKKRTIIFTTEIHDAILDHIQQYNLHHQQYLFQSNHQEIQKPISSMTIERHFKKIAIQLDQQESNDPSDEKSYTQILKPHNLRHSYAVTNLEKGLPINAMQKLLGHSNITTTQIYTELNSDGLSDAIAKVN